MITVTTAKSAEPPPPPPPTITIDPRLLALEADLWLSRGNRRAAEFLSRKAEAIREAAHD